MAGKKEDSVVEYIAKLPSGSKVSVRNLSKELDVSEGTAYKAIKRASELQLVETIDRVGTVRLDKKLPKSAKVTLLSEAGRLGLTLVAGPADKNSPIEDIVLGVGSITQFAEDIGNAKGNVICVIGERFDLLYHAVTHGCDVIVSGGLNPGAAIISIAEENNVCIFTSNQDAYTILNRLCSYKNDAKEPENNEIAENWMHYPPYLYFNDVVADWYTSYKSLFGMSSDCAVVDDDLNICASADASKILSSPPSAKISSIYSADKSVYSVDVSTPIVDIADHMVANNISIAYITRDGALCGIITSNDIIRFYQQIRPSDGLKKSDPVLQVLDSSSRHQGYSVALGSSQTSSEVLINLASKAAAKFARDTVGTVCTLEHGYFYFSDTAASGDVIVMCELEKNSDKETVVEVQIYDESTTFAKCMFFIAKSGK